MDSGKAFRVERIGEAGDHGRHSTKALAEKRIRRLVSMSRGKLKLSDFRVIEPKQ